MVLANGSVLGAKGKTAANARLCNENEVTRKKLLAKGVDVKVEKVEHSMGSRTTTSGGLRI